MAISARSIRTAVPGRQVCDIPGDQDGDSVPRSNGHSGQRATGDVPEITRRLHLLNAARWIACGAHPVTSRDDMDIAAPSTMRGCVTPASSNFDARHLQR